MKKVLFARLVHDETEMPIGAVKFNPARMPRLRDLVPTQQIVAGSTPIWPGHWLNRHVTHDCGPLGLVGHQERDSWRRGRTAPGHQA